MIIELIAYEVITTGASILGIKALSGAGLNRRLQGINRPKQLPIIDRQLKRMVGQVSKRERWLSRKVAKTINNMSRYQAFQYLLILIGRSQLKKVRPT